MWRDADPGQVGRVPGRGHGGVRQVEGEERGHHRRRHWGQGGVLIRGGVAGQAAQQGQRDLEDKESM